MEILDPVSRVLQEKGNEVISIRSDESVYSAIKLMAERKIGALLVIDDGRLVGVLSERDYARKVVLKGKSSHDTRIREIMTESPITVGPEATIDEAMRVMTSHKFRHLPVVDGEGRVAGVLSIGDLVNWMLMSQEQFIKHLENFICGGHAAGAASGG
jgi:CBS domain-containing protein